MPLCSFFFILSCLPLRHLSFSLGCPQWPCRVVFSSGQLDSRTNITHVPCILFIITSKIFCFIGLSPLFLFTLQLMFPPPVSPPWNTLFLHFQLKSGLSQTGQERLIFPPTAPQNIFVLLLQRTKPTCCCKTELFVFPLFSPALRLPRCPSDTLNLNPVKFSPCRSSLQLCHPVFTSLLL